MRSYYAHLATTSTTELMSGRPTFRASAIFPAIHQDGISSRVLFMGYWMLKRNIDKVGGVATLRSMEGKTLARKLLTLTEAKAYSIEVSELLIQAGNSLDNTFLGSIEIEFFAASNLVFAFPATVINYYGDTFSSVVHTAQRIYNDFDDMQKNSQTNVPESGFNIHVNDNTEPFISLINGPLVQENNKIDLQFFNGQGDILEYTKSLGTLQPYQTIFIYPAREIDLKTFLGQKVGACKAKFNLSWVFPRLLVGNRQKNPPALVITHTYYDCSAATSESDYWRPSEPEWDPASLMIPVSLEGNHYTNIYFYPIYSPSLLTIDIELYASDGNLLATKKDALSIKSPAQGHSVLQLRQLAESENLLPADILGARVIARPVGESKLPARVKIALDIGTEKGVPCNICMNLQPFNPPLASKPHSFKWLPLLADKPGASIWLMNSSPQKNFSQVVSLELSFYREKDSMVLRRNCEIPPNGFMVIYPDEDPELINFLDKSIGWLTVISNNAFLTTYYFSDNPSGVVGGDHGF